MQKEFLFSLTKKDFIVQTFRSGGKGGQHQNKTDSGVRIIHNDSGARGESREQRSQLQNKKAAFKRLTESPKFKLWLYSRVFGKINEEKELQKIVDGDMKEENLFIEYL